VFVRARRGTSHVHVGTVHAADAELALQSARDLYTRRSEGVCVRVVPTSAITASQPDEADSLIDPAADKLYRHASHYPLPAEVDHM
jgi:ring-1,2-phenylacetyl-CoA epoxidase subunit PaaB